MVRGQWGNLSRILGLHPYSFSKDILGFLMTTEIQDLGLTSHPKDGSLSSFKFLFNPNGFPVLDKAAYTCLSDQKCPAKFSEGPARVTFKRT